MRVLRARALHWFETAAGAHPRNVGAGRGCKRYAVEGENLKNDRRMILIILHCEVVRAAGRAIQHSPHFTVLAIDMKRGIDLAVH